jgi:peptide-methionine (S)-S-oxide reductase
LNGLLYGIVVYAVMNFVVLPLSAYPHKIQYTLRGVLVIMLCVGLPISFAARNLMTEKKESLMNTICSLIFILFSLFISVPAGAATSTATLAGGCYWCMEEAMEHVPGVVSVTSGFSGGVEAVEVHFDTAQITYDELLNAFWRNIDPTDAEGQFCDRGDRYRSAIFYHDQQQKLAAERSKEELATKWNKSIATTILPAAQFHPAPDQDYYKKQPYDYKQYKIRCGRERRLRSIWKETKGNQ